LRPARAAKPATNGKQQTVIGLPFEGN